VRRVDEYTKLKPYDPYTYSPHKSAVKPGELGVLLAHPRGYCVVVSAIANERVTVHFLDSVELLDYSIDEIIPTGKTPASILQIYEPNEVQLAEALTLERTIPDFSLVQRRAAKPKGGERKKKFDLDNLSKEEKQKLKTFIEALLKGDTK
jgi:hypothetical protein